MVQLAEPQGNPFRQLDCPTSRLARTPSDTHGRKQRIGLEAGLQFAEWGAHIVLGWRPNPPPTGISPKNAVQRCLDAAKAAGHTSFEIEWWACDMASLDSVNTFAQRWPGTDHALDLLCNNASMTAPFPDRVKTNDGFEIVHQVSHIKMSLIISI